MALAHFAVGNGTRPALLLHGFLGSGRNLSSLARRWSQHEPERRFIVPDLTGHGTSPALPTDARLDDVARDVLATIRALDLKEPVEVIGHSLGGRVALAASLLEPHALGPITLLDIAPGPLLRGDEASRRILQRLVAAPEQLQSREEARGYLAEGGLPGPIVEWILMNLVPRNGGYTWRIDRQALADFRPRMTEVDLWPAVERAGARVRCIRGGDSGYVTDADVARFERAGCRVDTLPGSGHFVHVDRPNELLALLEGSSPG